MPHWNVLVVGNGAREHALVWKLRQSAQVDRLFCAPGNAGTAALAETVDVATRQIETLADWSAANRIDLVVVGPEEPLARGLADRLGERGIPVFGPSAQAARLESSKAWAKELMREAGVPTAAYAIFDDAASAWSYAREQRYPLVLKADGLAAGKGVVIAQTPDEARAAISAILEQRAFGEAGRALVIEEYLRGEELSLLALVSGSRVIPLVPARDHKRIGDGDVGPNTGGMGAIAPSRLVDRHGTTALSDRVLKPVVEALTARGLDYRGVLYAGLMLTDDGPKVLEFNCRFGDPETQVILPLLGDDLAELTYATAIGELGPAPVRILPGYRCAVVLASGGYPGSYQTGLPIRGLDAVDDTALVFHAGTAHSDGQVVTAGGRVLTVVGSGDSLRAAREHAYRNAARIEFEGLYYRQDIGAREIEDSVLRP